MGKKLLSMLLVIAMMVSMIPAGYADEITVVEEPIEADDIVIAEEPAEEPVIEEAPAEEPAIEKAPAGEPAAEEPAAAGDDVTPLTLDVEATAVIAEAGGYAYFSFTPEETDEYVFTSMTSEDTYGYLYDSDWNTLCADDDGSGDRNFRIQYTLYAGETYYFGARYFSSSSTGSFPVKLFVNFDNHLSVERVGDETRFVEPGQPATLEVSVSARDMNSVHIEWRLFSPYGEDDGFSVLEGETGTSLTIAEPYGRARYGCYVYDDFGASFEVSFILMIDGRSLAIPLSTSETSTFPFSDSIEDREVAWAVATPTETYTYRFNPRTLNSSSADVNIILYDADLNRLKYSWDNLDYALTAGETYYYAFYFYDGYPDDVVVSLFKKVPVTDFETLKAAIALGTEKSITVVSDSVIEVTEDYTIPQEFTVSGWSADFIVAEGVELTVEGSLYTRHLTVSGTLSDKNSVSVTALDGAGTIRTETELRFTTNDFTGTVICGENGCLRTECSNADLVAYCGQQLPYRLKLSASYSDGTYGHFTISQDLTVPSHIVLDSGYDLTIESGCTLTNFGRITGESLNLYGGGTLVNNGLVSPRYYGIFLYDDSVLENHGTLRVNGMDIGEAAALIGDGTVEYGLGNGNCFYDDLTIPEGMILSTEFHPDYDQCYWYVYDNATIVNNGEVRLYQLNLYGGFINNGILRVQHLYDEENALVNNGTLTRFSAKAVESDFYVAPESTVTLEVSAESDDPDKISYEWYRYEKQYYGSGSNDYQWRSIPIEGETGSSLTFGPVSKYSQVYCKVNDGYGGTENVWFTIHIVTNLNASAAETDIYVSPGEAATLEVRATSDYPDKIGYQWYEYCLVEFSENGDTWTEWVWRPVEGETGPSFITAPIYGYREFYCLVSDGYGSEQNVWFYVNIENHFSAEAVQDTFYVSPGATATLEVSATADVPDKITYKWCSVNEDGNWDEIDGASASSYVTPAINAYSRFVCIVEDGYGGYYQIYFSVYINTNFSAEAVQTEFSITAGVPVVMEINASSDYPEKLSFRWEKYHGEIYNDETGEWSGSGWIELEETGSSLSLPAVMRNSDYRCTVNDGYGATREFGFNIQVEYRTSIPSLALPIELDAETVARIADTDYVFYAFTPEETEEYILTSSSDRDTYATLYNAELSEIDHNDDGGENSNFRLSHILNAGETYYYAVRFWSMANSGPIPVLLTIGNNLQVTADPTTLYVAPNETATLTVHVTAKDTSMVTYTWYDDGGNTIDGADAASFTTPPVTGYAHYVCLVQDGYGSRRSIDFYVYVENHFSAEAVQQTFRVAPETAVTLEVDATSDDPDKITYKWYDYNWDVIPGETGSSLLIPSAERRGQYVCYVEDGYGSYDYVYFQVYIETHFEAGAAENPVRVPLNETATLTVVATSDCPEKISYQWYDDNWNEISGETGSSFVTPPVTGYRQYVCEVRDGYGSGTSVWFEVSVETHFEARAVQSEFRVAPETAVTLEVDATSDAPEMITYRWYDDSWNEISGETGSSFTAPPAAGYMRFICTVEDGYGASQNIYFYIYIENHFEAYQVQQTVYVPIGETATLEMHASSDNPEKITFIWYQLEGSQNSDGSWSWDWPEQPLAGETGSTLTVGPVTEAMRYYCNVQDGYGESYGYSFYVYVNTHFNAQAVKNTFYVPLGETAALEVRATSDDSEKITYQWYEYRLVEYEEYGNTWTDWVWCPIEGETGPEMTTPPITEYTRYNCLVSDGYGNSNRITFYVYIDIHFSAETVQQTFYVAPNETVTLEVNATSDDPEKITYQWYDDNGTEIPGETGSSFITPAITGYTTFFCNVSDGYGGNYNYWFYIYLETHFSAGAVQSDFNLNVGDSATLEVSATSDDPGKITYTWYQLVKRPNPDGSINWQWPNYPMQGETGSTLTVGPISEAMRFVCRVEDGYGAASEITFYIFIETHFSARAEQESLYIAPGEMYTMKVLAESDLPEQITYQWIGMRKDYYGPGENDYGWTWDWEDIIPGATDSSYTGGPLTEYVRYICCVSDGFGRTENIEFSVYIDTNFYARARQDTFNVAMNDTPTLEVVAESIVPEKITYQWYKCHKYYWGDGESDFWWSWGGDDAIPGATDSSYTVEPVTEYGEYVCLVRDGYGSQKDVWFSVGIETHFDARAYDDSVAAPYGEPATLIVVATSDYPEKISYQWYLREYYTQGGETYDRDVLIEGATDSSYTTGPVTGGQEYSCRVSDGFGRRDSIWFNVSVDVNFEASAVQNSFTVNIGDTVTLEVSATSDDPDKITYKWYKAYKYYWGSGEDDYWWSWDDRYPISGETGSSFTPDPVEEPERYICRVEDGYGGYEDLWFHILIDTHFNVEAAQTSFYLNAGETAALEVSATSDHPEKISYRWYKAHKYFMNESEWTWSWGGNDLIEGETGSSFVTPPTAEAQAYVCQVSDGYGSSQTVWFYVYLQTNFRAWSETNRFRVAPETVLTLEVFAESDFPEKISFQWYEYNNQDGSRMKLDGETGSSFTTPAIVTGKTYFCHIEDGFGETASLYFTIQLETHFSARAVQRTVYVPLGGEATLEVVATSDFPDKITYQWYGGFDGLDEATGSSVTVGPVNDERWAYCIVSDGYGTVYELGFDVKVATNFSARAAQAEFLVAPGSEVTLEVIASSDYPDKITYEWHRAYQYYHMPTYWDWREDEDFDVVSGPTLNTGAIDKCYRYYCMVSDGYNNPIWISFDITIDSGFRITSPTNADKTQTVYVPYEQTTTLQLTAASRYPDKLSYQWYSSPLYNYLGNYYPEEPAVIEGATGPSLTTDQITAPTCYMCMVTDGYGNTITVVYHVFVQTHFSARAEQESFYLNMGDDVTLNVIAECDTPDTLRYSWYLFTTHYESYGISEYWEQFDGLDTASVHFTGVDGYYKIGCFVSDGYGNSKMVYFYLYIQNHFNATAVNPVNAIGQNDTVELKTSVTGDDLEGVSYQWFAYAYSGMGAGYYRYMLIDGATDSSYVADTQYSRYLCIVTDRYGTPISLEFEVRVQTGDGYRITITDLTKGAASTSLDLSASYSGTVNFTVTSTDDKAVLVLVKTGSSYSPLVCTTSGTTHSFTLTVSADTELVLVLKGDVTMDGQVQSRDGNMASRASVGKYTISNPIALLAADADGNGKVESRDGNMISRASVNKFNLKW